MSYVDIFNRINLSTLKERRDYLCKKYFINMQARSHDKVNCLQPEKGMLTMICDVVICTHYIPVTRTNNMYSNSLISWGVYNWQ